jgi:hypothetical protein
MIETRKLTAIESTDGFRTCTLTFLKTDSGTESLQFPFDQLDELVERALQVQRPQIERTESDKHVLLAQSVEVGVNRQSETLLATYVVGRMRFTFALSKGHAVKMAGIIHNAFIRPQ